MDFGSIYTGEPCGDVVEDLVYLSRWGQRWLKHAWNLVAVGGPASQFANKVCAEVDASARDPDDYLDVHEYTDLHRITSNVARPRTETRTRTKAVIRKGCRSRFAAALSKLAYNKFGERPLSEANLTVTRKWLQKHLEGEKYINMRTSDKNLAIDRALFLSFVPTKAFQQMRVAITTSQWEKRMDPNQVFGGFWSRVFGVGKLQNPLELESH
jgi:hypothetical protein